MGKKTFSRRAANRLLAAAARVLPGSTSVRPFLHKLRGVRIKGKVFIGDDVYVENEYPEQIQIDDGAQICLRSILIAHSHGVGSIVIERDTFIGASCVVLATPGRTLTIGSGAVITAGSVVSSDVPSGTLYGIEKAKPLAHASVPLKMDTSFNAFLAGLRPLKRPDKK